MLRVSFLSLLSSKFIFAWLFIVYLLLVYRKKMFLRTRWYFLNKLSINSRSRDYINYWGYNYNSCRSFINLDQNPYYFNSAYCPKPLSRFVFYNSFRTIIFLRASSLCLFSSSCLFDSSYFLLFSITSSKSFRRCSGQAYLELLMGLAAELAIRRLAIDYSRATSDFLTLKS